MTVEAFQFKYTAEEMQQLLDNINDKHTKIDLNAEEIEKIKERLESAGGSSPSYTEEELQAAILDIINAINSEEKTTEQKEE